MYVSKMTEMLQETETYKDFKRDSTKGVVTSLRGMLVKWRDADYISNSKYRMLLCYDGILPNALPKIHKQNCSYHLIVSSLNNPLYQLAVFLHSIIIKNIPKADSHIKNSS